MNISATINAFRVLTNPSLILPHATVSSFNDLPIPVSTAFKTAAGKHPDIRAVILDKDNCFAIPHQLTVHKPYTDKFNELRKAYPGNKLLIVSNSSGTGDDPGFKEADQLALNTSVHVLRHTTKKPGCYPEILEYLRADPQTGVTSPDQVAIIGDRLFTDVLMANMMGSWGLWVRDGVDVGEKSFFGGIERRLASLLKEREYKPPSPLSRELRPYPYLDNPPPPPPTY